MEAQCSKSVSPAKLGLPLWTMQHTFIFGVQLELGDTNAQIKNQIWSEETL